MLSRRDKIVFSPPPYGCVLSLTGRPFVGDRILDNSPYGNHGTITGATWARLPSGLWVNNFDGTDDKIDCGKANQLANIQLPVTLMCWIQSNVYETNYAMLITKSNKVELRMGGNTKAIRFVINDDESGANSPVSSALVNGKTYLVCGVHTGALMSLFINGASVDSKVHSTAIGDNSATNLIIGGRSASFFWVGQIALPRIFNRALSATEISKIWNNERWLFGV